MLLAQELALISILPELERPERFQRMYEAAAMSGLLAAEISLLGRIHVVDGGVRVNDDSPTGDELLDDVVSSFKKNAGWQLPSQLRMLVHDLGGVWDRVLSRLETDGLVESERVRELVVIPTDHHQADQSEREAIIKRLYEAATSDSAPDIRTSILLAVIHPANLDKVIVPDRSVRVDAKVRLREVLDEKDVDETTRAIIGVIQNSIRKVITWDR